MKSESTFRLFKNIMVDVFICSWMKHDLKNYGRPPYRYQKGYREKTYFYNQIYECKRCHTLIAGGSERCPGGLKVIR